MAISIDTVITNLQTWMDTAGNYPVDLKNDRTWCLLGYTDDITQDKIQKYFDRKDLNDEYASRYKETDISQKQPYTFYQAEIDLIYGFQKAFVSRHKSRLQYYRDDVSQKTTHVKSAINLGYARFQVEKDLAEK